MSNEPSFEERQALGNLIKVLESKNYELKDYYRESFEGWDPIYDSGITGYRYYKALKDFPLHAKRCIIQTALKGWNIHKDLLTLHETITSLIYLDLCGPAEYYFMQILNSFIREYGSRLGDLPYIEIESYRVSDYTIRFWKDDTFDRDTYGIIDFQLHPTDRDPVLAIVPWNSLLRTIYDLPSNDENDELSDDEIEEVTSGLYSIFNNEWVKTHCPWIKSNWDFQYQKEQMGRGVVYILHSLNYYNSNGI